MHSLITKIINNFTKALMPKYFAPKVTTTMAISVPVMLAPLKEPLLTLMITQYTKGILENMKTQMELQYTQELDKTKQTSKYTTDNVSAMENMNILHHNLSILNDQITLLSADVDCIQLLVKDILQIKDLKYIAPKAKPRK